MPGIKSRAQPGQRRLRGELLAHTRDWMTAVKWGLECDSRPNTHRCCPHCGKQNAKVPLSTKALGGILKLLSIVAGWACWRNTKWCLKYVNRTNAIVSGSEKAFVWFSTNSEVTVIYLDVVECTCNSSTQKTEVEAAGIWVQGQLRHSEAIYLFIYFILSFFLTAPVVVKAALLLLKWLVVMSSGDKEFPGPRCRSQQATWADFMANATISDVFFGHWTTVDFLFYVFKWYFAPGLLDLALEDWESQDGNFLFVITAT